MKPVPRRNPEVFEADGRMEDEKPALGRAQDVGRKPSGNLSFPYPLGLLVPERRDHTTMLLQQNSIVKQYYGGYGRARAVRCLDLAPAPIPPEGWAEMIRQVCEVDPLVCPRRGLPDLECLTLPRGRDILFL